MMVVSKSTEEALKKPIIIDDDPSPNHRQERSTAGSNDRSDRGASEDLQDFFTAWDEDNVRQEIHNSDGGSGDRLQ
jgi:hypothetical protein